MTRTRVIEIRNAIKIEYAVKPEYEELRSSSKSLNARTDACIAPIPRPRSIRTEDALSATFLGLPSRNRTKADSAITINRAYDAL